LPANRDDRADAWVMMAPWTRQTRSAPRSVQNGRFRLTFAHPMA
jgi:hypothetical protein